MRLGGRALAGTAAPVRKRQQSKPQKASESLPAPVPLLGSALGHLIIYPKHPGKRLGSQGPVLHPTGPPALLLSDTSMPGLSWVSPGFPSPLPPPQAPSCAVHCPLLPPPCPGPATLTHSLLAYFSAAIAVRGNFQKQHQICHQPLKSLPSPQLPSPNSWALTFSTCSSPSPTAFLSLSLES